MALLPVIPTRKARRSNPRFDRANCYDNAMMESFWATLKAECFHGERPATRQTARLQIFDYVEGFYNRTRLHSGLGYQSPLAFENDLRYSGN